MKIKSFRIVNYKSWADSGVITLGSGMNIVLGQNNAGKSALLEALSLKGGHKPHRTVETVPNRLSPLQTPSKVSYRLTFDSGELLKLLQNQTSPFYIPSNQEDPKIGMALFNDWLNESQTISFDFDNNNLVRSQPDAFQWDYGKGYVASIEPVTREIMVHGMYSPLQVHHDLFFYKVVDQIISKLYIFHAERYNIGRSQIMENKVLTPKAENLAQVLHYLMSSDMAQFKEYVSYVRMVLPQIKGIIIPPVGGNVEIKIWTIDPIPKRDDLAISLLECGTGVGQILAMLYVIVNSDHPQTILIDEPNSFLHPGAVRALMDIFIQFDHHQYIIASHSPFFLNGNSQMIHIINDGVKSKCEVTSLLQVNEQRLILEDLGAKLSDVSGADSVLWVEGQTEEHCYRLIARKFGLSKFSRVEILGVRAPGDFEGKLAESMYRIYTKLSKGTSVIPPAVGFIFDRELRSDKDCDDLKRESKGLVHFTLRRMFENYLLHMNSMASIVNEVIGDSKFTTAQIKAWIENNTLKPPIYESKTQTSTFSDHWLRVVNGGKLLQMMFNDLSEGKYPYDKVRHGIKLTELILRDSPESFDDIKGLIIQSLNKVAT